MTTTTPTTPTAELETEVDRLRAEVAGLRRSMADAADMLAGLASGPDDPDGPQEPVGSDDVADEVRCRRLVIVDDQGVERIVGQVLSDGPAVVVKADGLDGNPISVQLFAGDSGPVRGQEARYAGVHLFAGGEERAQLEVGHAGDNITGRVRTFNDDAPIAASIDVEAIVERLTTVERQLDRFASALHLTSVGLAGAVEDITPAGDRRPLYCITPDEEARLCAGADDRAARARALLAEVDALVEEQDAAERTADAAFAGAVEDPDTIPEPLSRAHSAIGEIVDRIERDR